LTPDAQKLTSLTVSVHNISSVEGIQGFSSLLSFDCSNNKLTSLPERLPSSIQRLNINYNKIAHLNPLPKNLRQLKCTNNLLTSLPELPNTLFQLDCSDNSISVLPNLKNLNTLFCSHNLLTQLPNLPERLDGLVCANNQLKSLPLLPPLLIRVSCQNNPDLTCLPFLPEGLTYLDISKNIICLPNIVKDLQIDMYEGIQSKPVSLPLCNDLRPLPCDTFPISSKIDSLNSLGKPLLINLFPNPTEGELTIKCENCTPQTITVWNAYGQFVAALLPSSLNLNFLASGIYFLKIETTKGEVQLKKIIRI
jgi:Leucine-rich repeat (LRR) protein